MLLTDEYRGSRKQVLTLAPPWFAVSRPELLAGHLLEVTAEAAHGAIVSNLTAARYTGARVWQRAVSGARAERDERWDAVPAPARTTADRLLWYLALLLGAVFAVWALQSVVIEPARFAVFAPRGYAGLEVASVGARLLGALALLMLSANRAADRLRWVAAGCGLLALGLLSYHFLPPQSGSLQVLNKLAYGSLAVRAAATAFFALGLVPRTAPRFTLRSGLIAFLLAGSLSLAVLMGAEHLPLLIQVIDPASAMAANGGMLTGLTPWHWLFSSIVLGVSVVTALATARHVRAGTLGAWLLIAMVLQVGAQLHNLYWLPTDSLTLTTGGLIRFTAVMVIAAGAIMELRRLAAERKLRLARAEEQAQRTRAACQAPRRLHGDGRPRARQPGGRHSRAHRSARNRVA